MHWHHPLFLVLMLGKRATLKAAGVHELFNYEWKKSYRQASFWLSEPV